jgi:hypothetical protein
MNTIPDLEHMRPPINSEILEVMLDRLYHIVPMSKAAADPSTSEALRQECLDRIHEETLCLGKVLVLINHGVGAMDQQLQDLIAHSKQRTESSLN